MSNLAFDRSLTSLAEKHSLILNGAQRSNPDTCR